VARILALDDSATILEFVRALLCDHEVVACTDWVDANRRIHQGDIDLVVVDQELEQFQGTFFVRAIRGFFGINLPVVVLSGKDVEDEALGAGATAFLSKERSDLLPALIERVLRCPNRGACVLVVDGGRVECRSCAGGRFAPGEDVTGTHI